MTAYSRKTIADFWQERTRTALVVAAIAIGIAGFSAVLSAYAILTRELNSGYLATNPASATLRTDKVDDALVQAALSNRAVSDAEARRVVRGRIKSGPAEWRGLILFVVKDFGNIRVGKLQPQQGAWPPARGEILIERDAFQVAHTKIGDTVTVKTTGGKEQSLRVTGSVHDVGQAQARMENLAYGYITLDTLTQLGEEPYLDELNILVAENRFDERHIRAVAADVRQVMESRGHVVSRMDIPTPGKHPHADIMGLLLLAMSSFGLCVLALSGILVVNLVTALMAAQIRQIGMMKAIGGTRWQIARIYLGQALLLGIVAILIALPLGILGSRLLCRYLAIFLNFDITSFAAPAWVYLLVAAIGLMVPLLAAAYPVSKASGVPVREALADFGASSDTFGTTVFDRLLAGMGGSFRPLLLAIRNSFRRRTRLALTLLTLSAGGLFFMSALNIRASMIHTLDRLFASRRFDLSVGLAALYPYEKVDRAIRNTPGVVQAEGWIVGEPAGEHFTAIAIPAGSRLLKPEIVSGRWLQPGDTNAIVLNTALAAKSPPSSWRVVGIAREPFSPAVGYVSREYLEQRSGHIGMANSVRLVLDRSDPASINAVKASLDRNLELAGLRALASSSKADSRYGFDQHMLMIYVFLIVISCILGGVGGLGLMTTMSLNVLERRREMGVLRAIGASPRMVWLIVAAEGVVVGVLSWALATLAAWPLSKFLGNALVNLMFQGGLDFWFEPLGVFVWLAVSIALGLAASFLPAWHASRVTVREALAHV